MSEASRAFHGSDPVVTRRFCASLRKQGNIGCLAASLFHAQKSSGRAKVYRGGVQHGTNGMIHYRDLAYHRKGVFLEKIADLLLHDTSGMRWGWGVDKKQHDASHVLYVDLPQGQVSFHSTQRFAGPDYAGKWDGKHASESRVIKFCHWVSNGCHPNGANKGVPAQPIGGPLEDLGSHGEGSE